jgi:hypothetical protein
MMLRLVPSAFLLAGTLAAQTSIQMSDPQFSIYTKNADFAHETANLEFAISAANRLMPAFVVITGDLINNCGRITPENRQAEEGDSEGNGYQPYRPKAEGDPDARVF